MKRIAGVCMALLLLLAGCTPAGGTVTMGGCSSIAWLATSLAEAFMLDAPGVAATYTPGTSAEGLRGIRAGNFELAFSSHLPADASVACIPFIRDGICIVVHPDNPVAGLTSEQLAAVFSGQVNNWRQLGGPDEAIVLTGLQMGSGTRACVEDIFGSIEYAVLCEGDSALLLSIAYNTGAIGYISHLACDGRVKTLPVDGRVLTRESILDESYPLLQTFYLLAPPEGQRSREAEAFIDFVQAADIEALLQTAVCLN